jgi:hypothetical protein
MEDEDRRGEDGERDEGEKDEREPAHGGIITLGMT